MISVTREYADRVKVIIKELRGVVQNELVPLLNQLESQCDTFNIEESLITEITVLINIHSENDISIVQGDKEDGKTNCDDNNPYNDLIIVLNELHTQEAQNIRYRIRR